MFEVRMQKMSKDNIQLVAIWTIMLHGFFMD